MSIRLEVKIISHFGIFFFLFDSQMFSPGYMRTLGYFAENFWRNEKASTSNHVLKSFPASFL